MGESINIYFRSGTEWRRNYDAFNTALRINSKFDKKYSYFSNVGGGAVLFMRGHNYVKEEVEAAMILADNGYNVLFTPESGIAWISRIDAKRRPKFVEGTINGKKYEQSTILQHVEDPPKRVRKSLNHALDKGAEISLLYDKAGALHRNDIISGIEHFRQYPNKAAKVKTLFVINRDKNLFKYEI